MIKRDNEAKGTSSCKIALYRTFLKCGVKTWEQVIKALEKCGHDDMAEQVKVQLLKAYSKVRDFIALDNVICIVNYLAYDHMYNCLATI